MTMRLTHASLFSGIGGAELAAAWAGYENIYHCEINNFGRSVLEYWFPSSESYADITTQNFTKWRGRVTVLTGGFPCQPFSSIGARRGADDDRYLWPHMLRAIRECQPDWVIGENVIGLISMVESRSRVEVEGCPSLFETGNRYYREVGQFTLDRVCTDIEQEGYAVQPIVIPACAVGAPHRRDRVWIIARRAGGLSRNHEKKTAANSVGERRREREARPDVPFLRSPVDRLRICGEYPPRPWGDGNLFPSQSAILGGDDGLPAGVDSLSIPFRKWQKQTIKAMGNAWVPQVAYEIFAAIAAEYEKQ